MKNMVLELLFSCNIISRCKTQLRVHFFEICFASLCLAISLPANAQLPVQSHNPYSIGTRRQNGRRFKGFCKAKSNV
jgi:hypothetical protein